VLALLITLSCVPQGPGQGLEVVIDCFAVIASLHRVQEGALPDGGTRRLDSLWRNVAELQADGPKLRPVKVKAHRSLRQATADGDVEAWAGNEQADVAAKKSLHAREKDQAFADDELKRARQLRLILQRAIAVHRNRVGPTMRGLSWWVARGRAGGHGPS
jgi:hypothetical protein